MLDIIFKIVLIIFAVVGGFFVVAVIGGVLSMS